MQPKIPILDLVNPGYWGFAANAGQVFSVRNTTLAADPTSCAAPRRRRFSRSQHFSKCFCGKQMAYAPTAPNPACRRSTLEARKRTLCLLYDPSLTPASTLAAPQTPCAPSTPRAPQNFQTNPIPFPDNQTLSARLRDQPQACVKLVSSSSLRRAAPVSIDTVPIAMPSRKVSTLPAATSAAAEFTSTMSRRGPRSPAKMA